MKDKTPKSTRRESPAEQRQRFIEAARELGCDEDEEAFDKALKKVASSAMQRTGKKDQSTGEVLRARTKERRRRRGS